MTDAELTVLAEQIRDETAESGNTALRVYTILKGLIDSKPNDSTAGNLKVMVENYNASTNLFPATGGSGTGGAVAKWNVFIVGTPGTLKDQFGDNQYVADGSWLIATADAPGQDETKWKII